MKRLNKENKIINERLVEKIKLVLFILLLISTYIISTKTVDYLLTVDVETLKRSLNIILVVLVVGLYNRK